MAGRYPVHCRVLRQVTLVEDDLLVFFAQPAETRFQQVASSPEVLRNPANPVTVLPFGDLLGMHPKHRPRQQEEVLHHLGHQPALLRFG